MKPINAIMARFSIENLINQSLPICYAKKIKELADALDPIISGGEDGPDFELERIELPEDLPIILSAADLKLLEPFIIFTTEVVKK